ncbi:MAG TPA: hypothetical protein VGF59_27570 [Bryobacteraceae bacterium]|jgi:hypothetical protein
MANIAIEKPPVEPRKRPSSTPILLPPLLFLAAMMMGADFTAIDLRPLKALQIHYPMWMDYAHFLIPGACAVVWLVSLRKWPNAGAVVSVLLCFTLVPLIPRYAESRIGKVPVTRWIDSNDLKSIEATLGVPLFEQGSREGTFVIVAPANEPQLRAELARLQLLGGPAAG